MKRQVFACKIRLSLLVKYIFPCISTLRHISISLAARPSLLIFPTFIFAIRFSYIYIVIHVVLFYWWSSLYQTIVNIKVISYSPLLLHQPESRQLYDIPIFGKAYRLNARTQLNRYFQHCILAEGKMAHDPTTHLTPDFPCPHTVYTPGILPPGIRGAPHKNHVCGVCGCLS